MSTTITQVRRSTDVLVLGDSLAGLGAALAARRAGKSVLLAVSGHAPASELTIALFGLAPSRVSSTMRSICDEVAGVNGLLGDWIDPAIAELAIDRILRREGIDLLLYAQAVCAVSSPDAGRASGVLMAGKDGSYVIEAGAVVDATESGVLKSQSAPEATNNRAERLRTLFFEFAAAGDIPRQIELNDGASLRLLRTWPDQVCGVLRYKRGDVRELIASATSAAFAQVTPLANAALCHTGHRDLARRRQPLERGQLPQSTFGNIVSVEMPDGDDDWDDLDAIAASGETAGTLAAKACVNVQRGMAALPEPARQQCDVVVVGAGTGGVPAAIAAARHGARTVLLEASDNVGGIGTAGGIHMYYHGYRGGLQDEIDAVTRQIVDLLGGPSKTIGFNPEAKKIAIERMLREAGVEVHFRTTLVDVVMDGNVVAGVVAVSGGKLTEYRCAAVVDGTGDGDVAARAGAEMLGGRDTDGVTQSYSLVAGLRSDAKCAFVNFDAGYVDPASVEDLTRARRIGLSWLWREDGFTADNRWTWIAPLIGLRESRHILADTMLTLDDQARQRDFDDSVAYGACHYDNHAIDYENESDEAMLWCWVLGFWDRRMRHGVPMRCLLPKGVDGVVMACRALGISHDAAQLFRMQRDIQRVGEAAGVAAALASRLGVSVRAVGGVAVREKLEQSGALRTIAPLDESKQTVSELVASLDQPTGPIAVWMLMHRGDEAIPALIESLRSDSDDMRWWASVTLAMLRRSEAADALLDALVRRDERNALPPDVPDWHMGWRERTAPRWIGAIPLLGRIGCAAAVEPLIALLAAPIVNIHAQIAAIRALARIGDASAVDAIRSFAARSDLPLWEVRRKGDAQPVSVRYEIDWKWSLAAAEALTELGDPSPQLAEPFVDHEFVNVREYARRVHAGASGSSEAPVPKQRLPTLV